tara:strand:- start:1183 stop:1440 length:258 start_codon:yes stop_codon:yes gene_type:complete
MNPIRKLKGEKKTHLTPAEQEIFTYILCGNNNKMIAEKMETGIGTVRAQLQSLYRFLGYRNKEHLLQDHLCPIKVQKSIDEMMGV